jgi:DNA topoisomerase IB
MATVVRDEAGGRAAAGRLEWHKTRRVRLRRSDPRLPGIERRRSGDEFVYYAAGVRVVDEETLERIRALVVPPAWKDVWISPFNNGHLQAVGTDAAGRRQYLYHELWRSCRDQEKFGRMTEFARALPELRRRVGDDLLRGDLGREQVLAAAARLLDLGLFRVGGESYASQNGTFGLATIEKDHVSVSRDGEIRFRYDAKGSIERTLALRDDDVLPVIRSLKRRGHGTTDLLAYRNGSHRWRDVRSQDINDYIKEGTFGRFTAKDFRTWHATVLAALGFARVARMEKPPRRPIPAVVKDVATQLGNTPAVCKASYIHPNVIEAFQDGLTIGLSAAALSVESYPLPLELQHRIEAEVVELLEDYESRVDEHTRGICPPDLLPEAA